MVTIHEAVELFRSTEELSDDSAGYPLLQAMQKDNDLRLSFEKLKRWEQQLQTKLENVEPTLDLEARLLQRIEQSETDLLSNVSTEPPARVSSGRRRRQLLMLVAVAATLLLALGWWQPWRQPTEPWTASSLASISGQWVRDMSQDDWQIAEPANSNEFALPAELDVEFRQSQVLNVTGQKATAYRGQHRRSQHPVYLFVIRSQKPAELPSSVPPRATMGTGGWLVASWQTGGFIYVLRLHGNANDYQSITGGNAPLAMVFPGRNPATDTASPETA